jgi:hypothetical protein
VPGVGRRAPCRQRGRGVRADDPQQSFGRPSERAVLGGGGEQREHGRRHQEAIGALGGSEAEGGRQGRALGRRQLWELVNYWPYQAVKPREGELGLDFNAGRREHRHVGGAVGGVAQQRRLAHPHLAAQHKRPALPARGPVEQAVDQRALKPAANQPNTARFQLGVTHRTKMIVHFRADRRPNGGTP